MITWIGSPNYDSNRKPIKKIVIHWMVGTLASTDIVFQNTNRGTSAHYGIEDDRIHQYVKESDVAYHAGVYTVNQETIGIEHSADPQRPASEATYQTSGKLIADICKRYNLPIDRQHIIRHSEVKATLCCGSVDIDKLISIAKQNGGVVVDNNGKKAVQFDNILNEGYKRSIFPDNKSENWVDDNKLCNRLYDHIDTQERRIADLQKQIDSGASGDLTIAKSKATQIRVLATEIENI